ncbi:MAG: CinA family protein [Nocardioides sp.]
MAVVSDLVAHLRGRQMSLATAESLTGGQLAAAVTSVPGASAVYLGGVVSYATEVKVGVLGVPEHLIRDHGVVSAQCAIAMALGARELLGAVVAVSTTGVAGPDSQEGRPVGTVYVGIADAERTEAHELALGGTRAEIQAETCRRAIDLLARFIGGEETSVR